MSTPEPPPTDNAPTAEQLPPTELEKLVEKAQPWASSYGWIAGIAVVVVFVAAFVVRGLVTNGGDPAAWASLDDALSDSADAVVGLDRVTTEYAGSEASPWSRVIAAEALLAKGVEQLFTNRAAAVQDLDDAKSRFEALAADAPFADLRERALFGLATATEALAADAEDLEQARTAYERLLQLNPATPYAGVATERVEALKKGDSAEFYAWFAEQDPKPARLPSPSDLSIGTPTDPVLDPAGGSAEGPDFADLIEGVEDFEAPADPPAAEGE
ncbi:MAG: hypothetical protein AAF532_04850 [Planctomycetota bacterium]